jgi:ABC-2 type transport system ATP-binding protein
MQDDAVVRLTDVELVRTHFRLGPISLEVPKGFVTAIVGPNGSGKSTTFRMLLDISKPSAGRIEVLGEPAGSDDPGIKSRIGYLAEESFQHEDGLKGSDKAAFHREWYPRWDVNRYHEMLRQFEVDPNLRLGKMSKGMRRKFELALAMAHDPELLLLDEPSSGLDPLAWRTMIAMLHRYMEGGDRTILMASHVIEEVKRLADYIVFMVQGRVLGTYEKDELLTGWHIFYVQEQQAPASALDRMPGLCSIERTGSMIKAVSNRAYEAEEWLKQEGIVPSGRQALELDDILAVLVEKERLQSRHERRELTR